MKHIHYLFLVGAALLAGCHRDAERISYDLTGKYTAVSVITAANPIAMYTAAGQVTSQPVITRFLAKRAWLDTYFSATDAPVANNGTLTLTFRGNNRATLLSAAPGYATDSIRAEVTDQQLTSFRLQNLDSAANFTSTTYCPRPAELAAYIKDAYPGKKCINTSPATGYGQYCQTRPVRIIGAHGNQLYVPYFSWLVEGGRCSLASGGEWNTFNRAVLSHLVAGDTIVVQEREIALKR
ncbi:hypothetical protein QMK33_09040 [Hymenobacter sp. H14-R3]|uniref:hypothetical protein n=1 Tax=Hymenobacter sp. H14-R3 TaxID=3046308 RepID=UPI0024B91A86|nr:hypothetical protein [Hymenobacter sp. H14-R3]MDJ0365298.1 hypothetical protein [Hymenobacter sp. H14-R3]